MIRVDVGNDQKSLIHTHHIYPNIKWPLFTVFNFQENNCTEHFQPYAQLYKKEILHFIPVNMTYEYEISSSYVMMYFKHALSSALNNHLLCELWKQKTAACYLCWTHYWWMAKKDTLYNMYQTDPSSYSIIPWQKYVVLPALISHSKITFNSEVIWLNRILTQLCILNVTCRHKGRACLNCQHCCYDITLNLQNLTDRCSTSQL